jgi:hypothetical protein
MRMQRKATRGALVAIQIAAIPCAVFGTDLTTTAASYTLDAASVTKFKVAVTAPADPAACPGTCPKPDAQLVCKGACPAGCHCDGSWVLEIVAGAPALAQAPGLAFALSKTDVDVDVDVFVDGSDVYDSFATGAWQTAAFVTAHRHENVKGRKFAHNTVEFGQVDLCKVR